MPAPPRNGSSSISTSESSRHNVETPDVLHGLIPQRGNGRALITTRYRHWSQPDTTALRIGVLDPGDAVELLATRTGRPADAEADSLVKALGYLALAIEQAAAFCNQTGWTFPHYQEHLDRRAEEILADKSALLRRMPGQDQDLTVLTVWDNSMSSASAEAPGTRDVHSGPGGRGRALGVSLSMRAVARAAAQIDVASHRRD